MLDSIRYLRLKNNFHFFFSFSDTIFFSSLKNQISVRYTANICSGIRHNRTIQNLNCVMCCMLTQENLLVQTCSLCKKYSIKLQYNVNFSFQLFFKFYQLLISKTPQISNYFHILDIFMNKHRYSVVNQELNIPGHSY